MGTTVRAIGAVGVYPLFRFNENEAGRTDGYGRQLIYHIPLKSNLKPAMFVHKISPVIGDPLSVIRNR
jgi:hypothetical protein